MGWRRKKENYVIILVDAYKAFDNIQHPSTIKKKKDQTRNRRKYLNIIKITYLKKANIIYIQQWKTENISSKNRNKTRVSTFATSIQHSTGSSSQSN